jgi:hypothetical protein
MIAALEVELGETVKELEVFTAPTRSSSGTAVEMQSPGFDHPRSPADVRESTRIRTRMCDAKLGAEEQASSGVSKDTEGT